MLGIAQQSNTAAYTSAKEKTSVKSPPMFQDRVYFRNVIMYGMDLGARVLDLR